MLQKDLYIAALFEKMRFLLQEKDEWKVSFRNRCKAYSLLWSSITTKLNFECEVSFSAPWVPEVFLAYRGNFRCWPREKTSGTERCFLPSPLTFELFIGLHLYAIQIGSLQLWSCGPAREIMSIILRKTSWSSKFIALRETVTESHSWCSFSLSCNPFFETLDHWIWKSLSVRI